MCGGYLVELVCVCREGVAGCAGARGPVLERLHELVSSESCGAGREVRSTVGAPGSYIGCVCISQSLCVSGWSEAMWRTRTAPLFLTHPWSPSTCGRNLIKPPRGLESMPENCQAKAVLGPPG